MEILKVKLFSYLFLLSTLVSAQNGQSVELVYDNQPLKEVLSDIEMKFDVKFSYISDLVEGINISGDFSSVKLESLVKEVLASTPLNYQFIDQKNIVIVPGTKGPSKKVPQGGFKLSGKIVDNLNFQPVAFASVAIADSGKGAVTDLDGRFEIVNIDYPRVKLLVQMVGFKGLEKNVDLFEQTDIDIELEEAFVELEGIEITPGAFNIHTAEPRVHQLSKEEILFSPNFARDIYRTLSLVPGVSNTEFSSKARIRGGHSDETAIYLDNFEIYEPFHLEEFDGVFSVINTDFVEETKVLTGGFSPRYTDKISGIISVKTPDNISENETKISLDIINASIIRKQKISKKSSAFFGVRRGYVDLLLNQVDGDDDQLGIEPIFYDVWGKYNFQLNRKHMFSYNMMYSQDDFEMREQAVLRDDVFDSKRRAFYNWVNWKWLPSEKFYSITTFGHQWLNKDSDFKFESTISDDNIDDRDTDLFIINHNSIFDFHPNHSLEFGVEFKAFDSEYRYREIRTNRNASSLNNIVNDSIDVDTQFNGTTIAVYLQNSWKLTPEFILMGGLRASKQSYGEKTDLGPRFAASWSITNNLKANAGYGIFYQPDNVQKTRSYNGQTEPFEESSKSIHYTGSLDYNLGSSNVAFNIYYKDNKRLYDDFRLDFVNRIAGVGISDVPFDAASGTSRGFDLTYRKLLNGRHLISATYAYSKDRITDAQGFETYRDFDRRHSIILNNTFKFGKNFTLSTLWDFNSGQPYTPLTAAVEGETVFQGDGQIFFIEEDKNTGRLPAYHSLNVKLEKLWIFKKFDLNIYLNIVNLYNRQNIRNYTYDGETFGNTLEVTVFRDEVAYFPRFVTPGISVKF
ncbi:MAG: TonB-dependent receptor [Cyclobacteriaceae bacterium]